VDVAGPRQRAVTGRVGRHARRRRSLARAALQPPQERAECPRRTGVGPWREPSRGPRKSARIVRIARPARAVSGGDGTLRCPAPGCTPALAASDSAAGMAHPAGRNRRAAPGGPHPAGRTRRTTAGGPHPADDSRRAAPGGRQPARVRAWTPARCLCLRMPSRAPRLFAIARTPPLADAPRPMRPVPCAPSHVPRPMRPVPCAPSLAPLTLGPGAARALTEPPQPGAPHKTPLTARPRRVRGGALHRAACTAFARFAPAACATASRCRRRRGAARTVGNRLTFRRAFC
jgi:hypothetical protein